MTVIILKTYKRHAYQGLFSSPSTVGLSFPVVSSASFLLNTPYFLIFPSSSSSVRGKTQTTLSLSLQGEHSRGHARERESFAGFEAGEEISTICLKVALHMRAAVELMSGGMLRGVDHTKLIFHLSTMSRYVDRLYNGVLTNILRIWSGSKT